MSWKKISSKKLLSPEYVILSDYPVAQRTMRILSDDADCTSTNNIMIENLPLWISLFFGMITLTTLLLFYLAVRNSNHEITRKKALPVLAGMVIWLIIQAFITLNGFYTASIGLVPPGIMRFGILPPVLLIIGVFATKTGRRFADGLPLAPITWINVVRLPVELVLLALFIHGTLPQLMTFEGRNFDILSGITAPFIAYFGLKQGRLNRSVIIAWNFICLGLLLNIVINALFSAPSPLQRFGFEQPNIAILYFPFSWLPSFVVPVVLFGHLVSIRQLMKKQV